MAQCPSLWKAAFPWNISSCYLHVPFPASLHATVVSVAQSPYLWKAAFPWNISLCYLHVPFPASLHATVVSVAQCPSLWKAAFPWNISLCYLHVPFPASLHVTVVNVAQCPSLWKAAFPWNISSLSTCSFSSFPACYSSECGPVPISLEGGVPLEHLIMLSTYSFSSFPACYSSECGPVPISLEGGVPLEHLIAIYIFLSSFPACYSSECGPVPISLEGGVPLEHLISCVPGIQIQVSPSGVKKIQWAENRPPSTTGIDVNPNWVDNNKRHGEFVKYQQKKAGWVIVDVLRCIVLSKNCYPLATAFEGYTCSNAAISVWFGKGVHACVHLTLPCGHDTDYSFPISLSNFICKLGNPIDFGS